MSFDDYVNHITQKYRLATAIAVLNVKPSNLSIDEHIADLKNKINDNNMDTDVLNMSLGSDDFNFDDDVTIIDDNDFEDNAERESFNDRINILKNDSINVVESNENAWHEVNALENVTSLLKNVDGNAKTAPKTFVTNDITQSTFCESSQAQSIALTVQMNASDVDMQDNDFNETQTNESQDFIGFDEIATAPSDQDNTDRTNIGSHQSDNKTYSNNMKITEDFVKNNKKQRTIVENVLKYISKETSESDVNKTDTDNANPKLILNPVNRTLVENEINMDDYDSLIETQLIERNNDMANKVCQNLEKLNQNTPSDSQSTILYSLYGNTQDYTHVSQSQYYDLNVHDNLIHGSKKYNDAFRNTTLKQFERNPKEFGVDILNNVDAYNVVDSQTPRNRIMTPAPQIIDVDSSEIQYIIDKNGRTYCVLEGLHKQDHAVVASKILNKNTDMHDSNAVNSNQNIASQELFDTNDVDSHNNAVTLENSEVNAEISELKDKEDEKQNLELTQDINDDYVFDDVFTTSQKEAIPFKVIEELNKIKIFLNRKMDRRASTDSYSMDSGYKSDSQSKSSFKSALQLTGNAINQSAHCVYTYLLQCPLVGCTKDITTEIATMLGRLIDRLHENEKYPSFLEDILDSVDTLLTDVSEGENSSDVIILTKDESIQRFLLLNKSLHVIKYSIDKITSILDKLNTYLTNEDNLYELTNVDVTENVCYVFHILEILIKRYRKLKRDNSSSQNSTQNSQDSEGVLKKSSITDIWRKKWNPDCKNVKIEGSLEKTCALTRCGVVLNKVIVDCMEGYSLISFAALQCFNLLQS